VVAHAVLSTPDDGCKEHPKHVERSCSEIKYILLTATSCLKLIYIRLVMHGTMNVKFTVGLTEMDYADVNWTARGKCWFLVLANLEFWLLLLRKENYFQSVKK
jgi:hypothetical protein